MSAPATATTDEPQSDVAAARDLEADGRPLAAIQFLMDCNRRRGDRLVEEELVRIRHEGYDAIHHPSASPAAIAAAPNPGDQLPELSVHDLTAESLCAGMTKHGCVLVKELVTNDRAVELARGVDRALAAFDAGAQGAPASETSPWYRPFTPLPGDYRVGGRRNWMRASGGMWTVDSPRLLFDVLRCFEDIGIGELLTEHFGERPALSANKCNLRRVAPDTNTNWHQDGAFLGAEVNSVNVWLGLSHCGVDAPGLDFVPRRFDALLETGTEDAVFDWSVSPSVVERLDAPVLRPELGPGDALLFDHLFLHRTGVDPEMTQPRHAIETWFFAPSAYPKGQIPVLF